MMEDRCICCGEIIPEGRQVCINCENNAEKYSEKWKIKKLKSKMVHIGQANEIKGKKSYRSTRKAVAEESGS